jgi:hypothetical protein
MPRHGFCTGLCIRPFRHFNPFVFPAMFDTTAALILSVSFVLVLSSLAGVLVAGSRQFTGSVLGLLLGPVGVFIAAQLGKRISM